MSRGEQLRRLLQEGRLLMLPCCFDALSARVIASEGFPASLVSGFAVSGSRLGLPDTGLISFAEMRDQIHNICAAVPDMLVIADGDTGFGNAINAQRTVREYARSGVACVMIEDQVSPKRCGHTKGKGVVDRNEARVRIRASVEAARETGVLIIARTDARGVLGLDEALERARMFAGEGADIIFVEAPESESEMEQICRAANQPMMANMVRGGRTPILSPDRLRELGFRLAVYPMVPFAASIHAMREAVKALKDGSAMPNEAGFEEIKTLVGFDDYDAAEAKYVA